MEKHARTRVLAAGMLCPLGGLRHPDNGVAFLDRTPLTRQQYALSTQQATAPDCWLYACSGQRTRTDRYEDHPDAKPRWNR